MRIAHALVEVGNIFLLPPGTQPHANRQGFARRGTYMDRRTLADALIEHVDRVGSGRSDQRIRCLRARVADLVLRRDRDIACLGVERRPGIARIDTALAILAIERVERRTAIAVDACSRGKSTRLDRQHLRDNRGIAAGDTADGIAVGHIVIIGDIVFVADRHGAASVAPGDRCINTRRDLRIGHPVLIGREGDNTDLVDFDIGLDRRALRAAFLALLRMRRCCKGDGAKRGASGEDETFHGGLLPVAIV